MNTFEDIILKKYQARTNAWNKILDYVTDTYGGGHGHRLNNNETSRILIIIQELERLQKLGMSADSHILTEVLIKLDTYLDNIGLSSTQITHLLKEIIGNDKIKRPNSKKNISAVTSNVKDEWEKLTDDEKIDVRSNEPVTSYTVDLTEKEYLRLNKYADTNYDGNVLLMIKSILIEKGVI